MKITTRLVNRISLETRNNCHPEGLGLVLSLFSDGDTIIGASENDTIARGASGGGWDYRVACLKYPMSRAQTREYLEYINTEIERDAAEMARE